MARVNINVSGVHFEFDRNLLNDKKYHKLAQMCDDAIKNGRPLQFVEDRPSESFAAILTYYQTGELHMPTGVCPGAFRKELEYWTIDHDDLADCCLYRFHSFLDETETRQAFLRKTVTPDMAAPALIAVTSGSRIKKFRTRLWSIVDRRENTTIAKVYFVIVMLMVLVSIMNMALSTVPNLQRSLTKCELLEYLEHTDKAKAELLRERFRNPDCSRADADESISVDEDNFAEWIWYGLSDYYYYDDSDYNETETGENSTARPQAGLHVPYLTIRERWFEVIDYIVIAFFTMDTLTRLMTCPSVLKYFQSIVNIIDLLAIIISYVHIVVIQIQREKLYVESWIRALDYFQVFRTLRFLRVVRSVRASKVLAYSVRQNVCDGALLAVLMVVGIGTFGTLFYLIESRSNVDSIPMAWYWSIITMTTVGYGDLSPKSAGGRVLAALCACCGVLLLAVALPMFVNNFLTLYHYSCVDESIQKKRSLKTKLRGAVHAIKIEKQPMPIKTGNLPNGFTFKPVKVKPTEKECSQIPLTN